MLAQVVGLAGVVVDRRGIFVLELTTHDFPPRIRS
jgi:hypothetical protein